MSHTYHKLLYHLVWSTANREPTIQSEFEDQLHHFIGGAFKTKKCIPLLVGEMPDHIHAFVAIPPHMAIAEVIRNVKVGSTKWIKQNIPYNFAWQEGYGAFSVSTSNKQAVLDYVKNQKEHHKQKSFKDEFLGLLNKHEIEFDEKYLWL
jgi:putative transposase